MNDFYRSIHCLVTPSKVKEAFGLVICESMYCKTPVITSTSGAQEEIITNGEDGILINLVNCKSISDAIIKCMENPIIYQKLRENGYSRVIATFTINLMVSAIKEL